MCPYTLSVVDNKQVIINFHPAALEEICETISEFENLKFKKIFLNQFKLMGHESVKILYSVLRPLLVDEDQIEFFEKTLLPCWTSFSSFEDSKSLYLPIENPNSDFRMNERVFKYEESAFKEQNLKQLASEGLYFNSESAKKSKLKLANEKQKQNLTTYVDKLRISEDSHLDPFEILEENPDLYTSLAKPKLETMPNSEEYRGTFLDNLNDHLVDISDVNSKINIETTRTNYTHRKNLKSNFELEGKIKAKKREIKLSTKKAKRQKVEESKSEKDPANVEMKIEENISEGDQDSGVIKQVNKKNLKRKEQQRAQIILKITFNR